MSPEEIEAARKLGTAVEGEPTRTSGGLYYFDIEKGDGAVPFGAPGTFGDLVGEGAEKTFGGEGAAFEAGNFSASDFDTGASE